VLLCAREQFVRAYVRIAVRSALGEVMTIKGLLGFCECKGCMKRAVRRIVVKDTTKYIHMNVCEDCLFKF
jgi:hypothetical protein